MFEGKSILITGGAGSLGKELVKKLLQCNPRKIVVFSRDDQKHALMEQEYGHPKKLRYWIGDIKDLDRLRIAFQGIDYVIHCAALKHVERGEDNPIEYKHTIVDGAENIIQAAIECGVDRVIALSTDKACAPFNTYGACKLMSDKLFMAANSFSKTKFSVIRYGNVIGSNGSIIDKMKRNPSNEIKITNRDMTRFWITLDYATELVLHLLDTMNGGELLIPKLPSMNVLEFLKAFSPPNAKIIDVPIRAGEKIHESMFTAEDSRMVVEYLNYYIMYQVLPTKQRIVYDGQVGQTVGAFDYNSYNNHWKLKSKDVVEMMSGEYRGFPKLR